MKLLSSEELNLRYLKIKQLCSLLVRVTQICNQAIIVLNRNFYTSSVLFFNDAIPGLHFLKYKNFCSIRMLSCFLNFQPFTYDADPRDFVRVCLFCFRMNKGNFYILIQL